MAGEPASEGGAITREAENELGFEKVQVVRPAKMAEVPDDLSALGASGVHNRQDARKIVLTGNGFDEVPADAFAGYANPFGGESLVIGQREAVMLGCGDQVQPLSRPADVSGTLETRHEEGIEKRGTRDRFDCMRLSPIHNAFETLKVNSSSDWNQETVTISSSRARAGLRLFFPLGGKWTWVIAGSQ